MADDTTPTTIPTFTGNPVLDSAVRSMLMVITGSISTYLVTVLTAHGVSDEKLLSQIPLVIGTILSTAATFAVAWWSVHNRKKTISAGVDNAIVAASTGVVPEEAKVVASKDQVAAITKIET